MENNKQVKFSETTAALLKANEAEFRPGFVVWVTENWGLYLAFESEALRIASTGRAHYSARTIGEYLRHHTATREANSQFKLNDHTIPDMARLFALRHPASASLFEFRGSPNRPRPSHGHGYANMHERAAA
jgi:hypothetical protein